MGVANKIFLYIVPLVILIIILLILFGGKGLFGETKEAILGAKELLPDVSVGLEEQKAEVTIPDEHREQILNLQKAITLMLSGKARGMPRENCFADYDGISALKEEGTSLTFELRGDKTVMTVFAGSGGKQKINGLSAEFPKMKPCAIAGKGDVSERFFKHFIEGEQLLYPYYTPINSLRIFGGGFDYNGIAMPELELQSNLEDGGWLFTPDGEHICFFPTNFGVFGNTGKSGIGNEWFTDDEENSIPNRIRQGKLNLCS